MSVRLNKAIAQAGLGSRRAADRLIADGRVMVNGRRVTELGTLVDVDRDSIKVDGKRLPAAPRAHTYHMLHKPRGCVTTLSDPQGRPTIADLLPPGPRIYPVGRLDYSSEGLLLLTDDGELGRALMHPSSAVAKTYEVKVRGVPGPDAIERLRRGVPLEGRPAQAVKVRVLRGVHNAWCEIVVHEGRKHVVRRMFAAVGFPVQKLKRTGYAGLDLGRLPPGKSRRLEPEEVARLRRAAGAGTRRPGRRNSLK